MQVQIPYKPLVSALTGPDQFELRITAERLHLLVSLWVCRVLDCLNFLLNFIGWIQARSSQFPIDAFWITIPVVPGYSNYISRFHRNFISSSWMMSINSNLVVGILSPKVVDVIQRVEIRWSIGMQCLHDFIGDSANLRNKNRQEVVNIAQAAVYHGSQQCAPVPFHRRFKFWNAQVKKEQSQNP